MPLRESGSDNKSTWMEEPSQLTPTRNKQQEIRGSGRNQECSTRPRVRIDGSGLVPMVGMREGVTAGGLDIRSG